MSGGWLNRITGGNKDPITFDQLLDEAVAALSEEFGLELDAIEISNSGETSHDGLLFHIIHVYKLIKDYVREELIAQSAKSNPSYPLKPTEYSRKDWAEDIASTLRNMRGRKINEHDKESRIINVKIGPDETIEHIAQRVAHRIEATVEAYMNPKQQALE